MNRLFYLILIAVAATGCSKQSRKVASINLNENLVIAAGDILSDVSKPDFDSSNCLQYLTQLEKDIDAIDIRRVASQLQNKDDLKKIADISWQIRTALHLKLKIFGKDCVLEAQTNFRQFRFIEDYLMEHYVSVTDQNPSDIKFQEQPVPMLDVTPYYVFYGKEKFDPHGGDLLISRGLSFLSAMIARLGTRWTQFSHVVFIAPDADTGEIKTIESYVGEGVHFFDLKFALKNENGRILWLRPKDADLGARASTAMSKFVSDRIKSKNPIHYDYALDFSDHTTMSCAEVAQTAYETAPGGGIKIPFYPNEVKGEKTFLDHIGIGEGPTFEPGDMEIDPNFELMGEFRDLRLTRDSRQKDVVLSEMFRWMNEYGYMLHDSSKSKAAGGFVYTVRHTFAWPLFRKVLGVPDFSKEIPRKMLRTVTLLNQLGEVLLNELKAKDIEFQKQTGWPMTYLDLYRTLNEYRQKDLALYQNEKTRDQSTFHRWLRPQ